MKKDNIDNMFDFDEKSTKNTIKKAKLYSTLKTIGISVVVAGVVLVVVGIANSKILGMIGYTKYDQENAFREISGPNNYTSGVVFNEGLFNGEAEYSTYKIIGNKPVYNGTSIIDYSIFPFTNSRYGNVYGRILTFENNKPSAFNKSNLYNELGNEEMMFYHPKVNYKSYSNELNSLDSMDDNKSMEIALSFDKEYTVKEVQDMIPKDINLSWYWVDTNNEKDLEPLKGIYKETDKNGKKKIVYRNPCYISADKIYGMDGIDSHGLIVEEPEISFIQNIQYGITQKSRYESEFKRIHNNLSGKDGKIDKEDLKVIGVVVTGNVKDLKTLQNKDYIKGSTIGVVVD
jgi:hypothetical protein